MILTEEEAKTKRCHQSMGFEKQPAYPSHCIASACMGWRWTREDSFERVGEGPLEILRERKGPYSTTYGYCGKAGKP